MEVPGLPVPARPRLGVPTARGVAVTVRRPAAGQHRHQRGRTTRKLITRTDSIQPHRVASAGRASKIVGMPDTPEPERRWLGRVAAAAYLDCDPTTIDRLVDGGRLTRYKVGGMSRFDMYEMDAMVKSGAQTTGATRAG